MDGLSARLGSLAAEPLIRGDWLIAAAFVVVGPASAVEDQSSGGRPQTATLCSRGDVTLFACPIGTKLVSVCGRGNRAVYRFGKPRRLELQLNGVSLAKTAHSGGGEAQLTAVNKNHRYVIYDKIVRTSFEPNEGNNSRSSTGLLVQRAGRTISDRECGGSVDATISPLASRYTSSGEVTQH